MSVRLNLDGLYKGWHRRSINTVPSLVETQLLIPENKCDDGDAAGNDGCSSTAHWKLMECPTLDQIGNTICGDGIVVDFTHGGAEARRWYWSCWN